MYVYGYLRVCMCVCVCKCVCVHTCMYVYVYLQVSLHAETSMMTPKNLAIVFAPNLLRPFTETADTAINDTQNVLACIQSMIENAPTIFADGISLT